MNLLINFRSVCSSSVKLNRISKLPVIIRTYNTTRTKWQQQTLGKPKRLLPYEIDTAVARDVLLFKYENNKFYTILNIFAVTQFVFWLYLAEFAYSTLKDVSPEKAEELVRANLPPGEQSQKLVWWRRLNLGENKYRYGLTFLSLVLGVGLMTSITLTTRRTIKYLTLLRGGTKVQIVSYSPFWLPTKRIITSVDNLSCQSSRPAQGNSTLPLRVKGYRLYFLLDRNGEYTNTKLFDLTAGMMRIRR